MGSPVATREEAAGTALMLIFCGYVVGADDEGVFAVLKKKQAVELLQSMRGALWPPDRSGKSVVHVATKLLAVMAWQRRLWGCFRH